MIDAATLRICADAAKTQILRGVQAIHAGELLQAELHFSLAQQALRRLQRLLDEPRPQRPIRKLCLVGDRAPDSGEDLPAWMNRKAGEPDGAA